MPGMANAEHIAWHCRRDQGSGLRPAIFLLRSTAGLPKISTLDLKEAKDLVDEFAS